MAKKRRYDHNHIYIKLKSGISFKCIVAGCPHSVHGPEMMLGNRAQCPYCKDTFIIMPEHLRRKNIHCLLCTKNGVLIPKEEISTIAQDESQDDIFRGILETGEQRE